MVMLVSWLLENAEPPMEVTLEEMVTLVSWLLENAEPLMEVTLKGMVTLLSRLLENALSPMEVTGFPFILSGIVTLPPVPVYPVMVISVAVSV